jgi:endo-1,3(4)-beta-glucanase
MSTSGTISMKVYTDAPVGTLMKFKLESNEADFGKEQDVFTTVSGEWATYNWDLSNGDNGIYNVLTLMLGYATPNDASANATFLFDDIVQDVTLSAGIEKTLNIAEIKSYPNPAKDFLTISAKNENIKTITLFDILGNKVTTLYPNSREVTIDVSNFDSGVYIAKISTLEGVGSIKLILE